MYSLEELESMNPAEVVKIAEDMGMKKANSSSSEDVMYYILDNQASATAKEEASKVANRNVSKGDRRKNRKKAAPVEEAAADVTVPQDDLKPTEEAPAKPAPKKRGRKPKAAVETTESPAIEGDPTVEETAQPAAVETPKKRGRKPKVKVEEAPADGNSTASVAPVMEEPIADAKPTRGRKKGNTTVLKEPKEEGNAENVQENQSEKMTASNTNMVLVPKSKENNSSFDSFFGGSKGKTFKPRSPQERKEEESKPVESKPTAEKVESVKEAVPKQQHPQPGQQVQLHQPQQPVYIKEPGANSQNKQQFPKNMSKRQRQQMQRQMQQNNMSRFPIDLEGLMSVYGVLEIMPDGYGFLRSSDFNYLASPDDIYVTQQQIKQYGLRTGDVVEAAVRPPLIDEKYYPMVKALSVNGLDPTMIRDRARFEHLVPLFPDEKFNITKGKNANISTRIVDMFAPIGKGQRALIVAPPKTGKTILLKDIANAISENHPETYIIMLLIDERPEEVTDMMRSVNAEVIASTFDEPAERHVKIAGIVLEKAKRLVESGHDVVIMLDSITRLARAYNTVSPASGKILSGGVDANALQRPKRFFGAARNIEGGGSLTIIATALTETSSKMDEVIFEEFKGTGNMELQLDRKLSNKRVFPAVDIVASSTRRDDLLLPEETLNRMWILRNYLGDMNSLEAMEFIKKRMEMTRSNEELLVTMDQ